MIGTDGLTSDFDEFLQSMNLGLWRKAGPWGLVWGGSQASIIAVEYLTGLPVLNDLTWLSLFGLGAIVGVLLDDPETALRAFPLSQLVAILGGLGLLLTVPSILANSILAPLAFVLGTVVAGTVAIIGAVAGSFLVGIFEGSFARSLDWRVLVVASVLGLVPGLLVILPRSIFDSSGNLALPGGSLAFPAMIFAAMAGSIIAIFGVIRGGAASPRTFSILLLLASLTVLVGLFGFEYSYSFYDNCFYYTRLSGGPPCSQAGDLLNLVIVVGAGIVPSALVLFRCFVASDVKPATPMSIGGSIRNMPIRKNSTLARTARVSGSTKGTVEKVFQNASRIMKDSGYGLKSGVEVLVDPNLPVKFP